MKVNFRTERERILCADVFQECLIRDKVHLTDHSYTVLNILADNNVTAYELEHLCRDLDRVLRYRTDSKDLKTKGSELLELLKNN